VTLRALTFRTQTFLALGGVVLLLSGSFLIGMDMVLRRELSATLEQDLDATALAFRSQLDDASGRLRTEARVVAEEPRLKAALNTPGLSQATLDDIADELRRAVRWDVLALADADGALRSMQGASSRENALAVLGEAREDGDASGYWIEGAEIYQVAAVPLTYGETDLGVLAAGYAISDRSLLALKRIIGSEIAIYAGRRLVASTFPRGSAQRAGLATLGGAADGWLVLGANRFQQRAMRLAGGVDALILRSEDAVLAPYRRLRQALACISIAVFALAAAAALLLVRRTEARLRHFIQSAPDAILVLRDGHIAHANPSFLASLGYSGVLEVSGREAISLVHPDDRQRLLEWCPPLAPAVDVSRPQEIRLRSKRGTEVAFEVVVRQAEFEGSICLFLFARDVTERKATQVRLLQADRMASIGTLASGVAHEINNPLAYVIGNLDILGEALGRAASGDGAALREASEVVEDARQGADRVRRIVRDLKSFSRGDEDRRGPVDVQRVLESSISMSWNELRHRARLVKDFSDVPNVQANESRLGQVFINLLLNAAQAIDEGDAEHNEIRVSTRADGEGRVVVEVRDTGSGIPEHLVSRIFDPFFTTKPVGSGTGLGLAICHGIVEGFGGKITVETTVGEGTAFRVALPVAKAALQKEAEEPPAPPAPRRGRILVVDDEAMIGTLLRRLLSREHDVETLTRGQEAVAQIAAGKRFDLVLCDLMMPQMTGMDVYEAVKSLEPEQAERMVFLTGGAFTARARSFIDSVPNQFLEKPVQVQQLKTLIGNCLA
jgi:PAS domain S-box-containing protein